jgi:alpha-mannosidase
MSKIKTMYFINHSHTDIGFTDYQSVCYRQHLEFIDKAIDLCEETASYPKEAQSKWVCEATAMTERYLKSRPASQIDRFLKYYKEGRIDVTGMQYNLTPLMNIEQMIRSLYPIKNLKDEYGIKIKTAMNCDVNGASWLFADLLPELGVELFTMAINPVRGGTPKPRPSAFWWEGPSGKRLLVWNGYHYLFGSLACLGNPELAEKLMPDIVAKLENNPDYPFDFIYGQTTNPARVDNGPPDKRLPNFIRDWNAAGKTPRMELITVTEFNRILREQYITNIPIPTMRGDWTDWWVDGAASSAFETGLNRSTHELMYSAEFAGSWLTALGEKGWPVDRLTDIYENATLYDEHSWGSIASIEAPQSAFAKSHWNQKAHCAYFSNAETHDVLTRAVKSLASKHAEVDNDIPFDLGNLPPEVAKPDPKYTEVLVVNTLPYERHVVVEEPLRRSGQAPIGMLEMFVPRGLSWGVKSELEGKRIEGTVPGFGYAFLPISESPLGNDLRGKDLTIENAYYRITINPKTGGLKEWYDKKIGHDFAGNYRGWDIGQYIHETVDSPKGRDILFLSDWFHEDFGTYPESTPFVQKTATKVVVGEPEITVYAAKIKVTIEAPGVWSATCTFVLPTNQRTLEVSWMLDKKHITDPEAVFVAFPFNLKKPKFSADINGIALTPEEEQIPGSVRDWYPIQRWVDINDGEKGVTMVPLEAPLVQLGGITTGKWATSLEPESPTIMSWALNNHWMVNFRASQGGNIPLRYKLTTYDGEANAANSVKFGTEAVTEPIVLRDYMRVEGAKNIGQFMEINPVECFQVTTKPSENGEGIIVRIQNHNLAEQSCTLRFPEIKPTFACITSSLEENNEELIIQGNSLCFNVPGRNILSLRIKF